MELKNKNILLISPEPWDHIFVSKHHYATHLAEKGNQVFFLNPPTQEQNCQKSDYNNLLQLNYKGFIKGLRFMPNFIQRYFIRKKFDLLQNLCGATFDIVWSFDNSVFYDFSALPSSVYCISHIVDLNQNFNSALAFKTADICFGTTEFIINRAKLYNNKSFKITHGYAEHSMATCDFKLPGRNKIKVTYIGNLSMRYIDWEILLELIKSFSTVDFIFIGPGKENYSTKVNTHHIYKVKLVNYPNTYFTGKVASQMIPSILEQTDISLISYREEFHMDQANPHKFMEYLGSGNMILATFTKEYESLANKELIAMTKRNKDYKELFERVINMLKDWNSEEKKNMRKAFARTNSYPNQINRIETLINES